MTTPTTHLLHRLDLAEEGTLIGAQVVCTGGPTDLCRQWCAEGCEETCEADAIALWPHDASVELVAQAPVAEDTHRWQPMDPPSCRVANWLNAGDLDELCVDDDVLMFDEDGERQPLLRSGPIVESWDGDSYLWAYPEPALPEPTYVGHP